MRNFWTPQRTLLIGFALLILTGGGVLSLPVASENGQGTPFLDAIFTATSAVCVTGLVTVDTGGNYSTFGEVVVLLLIQIGGLGFMTFVTLFAIIMGRRIGLRERLVLQESLNKFSTEGVVRLVLHVALATLIFELVGALLLAWRWSGDFGWSKGAYYGIFHSISAFNNAGFDLLGQEFSPFAGLTGYVTDPLVSLVIPFLIILGGLGFTVIEEVYLHRRPEPFSLHTKAVLVTTAVLIGVGTAVFFAMEMSNPSSLQSLSMPAKIQSSFFQAVTPRTAGFNTLNIGALRSATQFFILLLMFVGASPGSTGGGIKTSTFAAIAATVWAVLRGKENAILFERRLPGETVVKAFTITTLAMGLVILVTLILLVTEKAEFLALMFEATSAFATVGLTLGVTPSLTAIGKVVIILTMFVGRLGPVTMALALTQRWHQVKIRYPEERVLVG